VFGTETNLYEAMYNYIKVEGVKNIHPLGSGSQFEVKVSPIDDGYREPTGVCHRSVNEPTQCKCNGGYDINEQGRS